MTAKGLKQTSVSTSVLMMFVCSLSKSTDRGVFAVCLYVLFTTLLKGFSEMSGCIDSPGLKHAYLSKGEPQTFHL